MSYCWEVYKKSECERCQFFQAFQNGTADIKKMKDIIIVEDEAKTNPTAKSAN